MYIYNNKNILFTKQHIYYKFIGSYITKNSKDDLSKILRKSREPTYRESFIIIWLEELSDLQLNESLYVCPTYQEIFKYKKKGLEIFVRVKPNPTYRVSDLSSLPV